MYYLHSQIDEQFFKLLLFRPWVSDRSCDSSWVANVPSIKVNNTFVIGAFFNERMKY